MAKQLKPGQLCTINGHVYRCKKMATEKVATEEACEDCEKANHSDCILYDNGFCRPCVAIFGLDNYPILVK